MGEKVIAQLWLPAGYPKMVGRRADDTVRCACPNRGHQSVFSQPAVENRPRVVAFTRDETAQVAEPEFGVEVTRVKKGMDYFGEPGGYT